jgi:hypothetical protein
MSIRPTLPRDGSLGKLNQALGGRAGFAPTRSGGADLKAQGDITIGGDVVGRDKIVQTINNLAAIQWFLHQLTPEVFRHPSEISRLYETRKRKLARLEALKAYLKDLKEVLASL